MHYTGMAAFEIAGVILWDPVLVAVSIALGAAIGAVALPVGLRGKDEKWKVSGAVLLTQSQLITAVADRGELSRADTKRALVALEDIVLQELGTPRRF